MYQHSQPYTFSKYKILFRTSVSAYQMLTHKTDFCFGAELEYSQKYGKAAIITRSLISSYLIIRI